MEVRNVVVQQDVVIEMVNEVVLNPQVASILNMRCNHSLHRALSLVDDVAELYYGVCGWQVHVVHLL